MGHSAPHPHAAAERSEAANNPRRPRRTTSPCDLSELPGAKRSVVSSRLGRRPPKPSHASRQAMPVILSTKHPRRPASRPRSPRGVCPEHAPSRRRWLLFLKSHAQLPRLQDPLPLHRPPHQARPVDTSPSALRETRGWGGWGGESWERGTSPHPHAGVITQAAAGGEAVYATRDRAPAGTLDPPPMPNRPTPVVLCCLRQGDPAHRHRAHDR